MDIPSNAATSRSMSSFITYLSGSRVSLTTDTTRHTEPRSAGNLKASGGRFGTICAGAGFAAPKALLVTQDAFCENGGNLLKTLIRRQIGDW